MELAIRPKIQRITIRDIKTRVYIVEGLEIDDRKLENRMTR